jgi:hypothetical protein
VSLAKYLAARMEEVVLSIIKNVCSGPAGLSYGRPVAHLMDICPHQFTLVQNLPQSGKFQDLVYWHIDDPFPRSQHV